jgi:hypothetical protein
MEGNLYEHLHINMDAYCKPYPSSHLVVLLVESHPSLPLDCLQGQSLVQQPVLSPKPFPFSSLSASGLWPLTF